MTHRRLGARARAWLTRRWARRGIGLLLVAVLLLLLAGHLPEPWRWLVLADGALLTWLALAWMARPGRPWLRACAWGTGAYAVPALVLLVAGTPWPLALVWPHVLVQATVSCPLGLPCPLGR